MENRVKPTWFFVPPHQSMVPQFGMHGLSVLYHLPSYSVINQILSRSIQICCNLHFMNGIRFCDAGGGRRKRPTICFFFFFFGTLVTFHIWAHETSVLFGTNRNQKLYFSMVSHLRKESSHVSVHRY